MNTFVQKFEQPTTSLPPPAAMTSLATAEDVYHAWPLPSQRRLQHAAKEAHFAMAAAFRRTDLAGMSDEEAKPIWDAAYNSAYDAEMAKPL